MKRLSLVSAFAVALMLVTLLVPTFTPSAKAQQPPVDTTTMYVGTIGWGPRRADSARAYDTGSGELIFNVYDTLIFTKGENYWEFEPSLAINVPERQEIIQDFQKTSFVETIYVRNHTALPPGFPADPVCTWWEDDMNVPIDKYHLAAWIDSGPGNPGELGPSDWVYMNAFWWAPPQDPKGCQWWHVVDLRFDDVRNVWVLTLEKNTDVPPPEPPPPPECQWYVTIPPDGKLYHINGWVDNNPDGVVGPCDILYIGEYENVTVTWYGGIQGWHLLPITKRTWHIIEVAGSVLHLHRFYYDFIIRTTDGAGNPIYFVDEGGTIVDTFDIYDAEYSLERGMVQDQYGSPMWMFYKPFFDQMNSDPWDTGDPADAIELAYLIKDAVEIVSLNPPTLRVNLGFAFPDIAFKQIMSQTWASMVSKEFSISIGCWNGELFEDTDKNCYPDWFETIRHASRSPYDKTATIPRPPGVTFTNGYRYVGTGPYRVITFDSVTKIVEMVKNDYYWKGWDGKHLNKIVIRYIDAWSARKDAFLAGEIDVCAVPRANMFELLNPATGEPITPGIITIKRISPALSMDALHFTFTVDPTSPYVAKRKDTGEILPNFFNNTHVRKAFSYAFNHTMYIKDAWFNEAIWRNNMLVYGLVPDYYDPTTGGYDIDRAKAIQELQAVVFPDGKTLYETGFTLGLAYNTGNDQRRIACEMIQAFFTGLGPQFVITIYEIDWPTYLDMFEAYQLPIWSIGWLADFADADNFARPYMHSNGDFAYYQNYTADNGWGSRKDIIIDLALKTPDGPNRAALYKELQQIYYRDVPFLPIDIPIGRRWCWYWVKGWYYNALYPAQYYYSMYKEDTCWFNISGPTPGVPDDVTNMRDVTYLLLHFNAKPPEPGGTPQPKWVGTYGVGGVDPYGDRVCNMRDVTYTILHFNHRAQP